MLDRLAIGIIVYTKGKAEGYAKWLHSSWSPAKHILTNRCPLGLHILLHFFSMSPLTAGEPAKFNTKLITMMSYNSGLSFCKDKKKYNKKKISHCFIILLKRCRWFIWEDADSRTGGIFIRDTAYFHCYSMNCDSQFSESQRKHAVSRMNMPPVRESASSLM